MTVAENNPLNLGYRPQDKWIGLAVPPNNGRWCVFMDPKYAFRAYTKELVSYVKAGHDTVPKFITQWAPASENPTSQYIVNVLLWSHLRAAQVLDAEHDALPLFKAMCRQEDGSDPYPDSVIQKGIDMALNVSSKPISVSQTAVVAGAGGLGYALANLIVGAFHDLAHIDITADRQVALAMVITVALHYFFPKGDPQ